MKSLEIREPSLDMLTISQAKQQEFEDVRAFYLQCGYGGGLGQDDTVFVAQLQGQIIGAVRLCPEDRFFVLRGMQVLPLFQRQGVGTRLLQKCAEQLADQPCYCIPWQHLRSFYQQVEFREVSSDTAPILLRQRFEEYICRGMSVVLMGRVNCGREPDRLL